MVAEHQRLCRLDPNSPGSQDRRNREWRRPGEAHSSDGRRRSRNREENKLFTTSLLFVHIAIDRITTQEQSAKPTIDRPQF
jgi:hypothetical protein